MRPRADYAPSIPGRGLQRPLRLTLTSMATPAILRELTIVIDMVAAPPVLYGRNYPPGLGILAGSMADACSKHADRATGSASSAGAPVALCMLDVTAASTFLLCFTEQSSPPSAAPCARPPCRRRRPRRGLKDPTRYRRDLTGSRAEPAAPILPARAATPRRRLVAHRKAEPKPEPQPTKIASGRAVTNADPLAEHPRRLGSMPGAVEGRGCRTANVEDLFEIRRPAPARAEVRRHLAPISRGHGRGLVRRRVDR